MKCKFKTIGQDKHKCEVCGYEITLKQSPELINRMCTPHEPNQQPSIFQKAVNFGGALIDHTLTGFENVNQEEQDKRMSICRGCGEFDKPTETCNQCGCKCQRKTAWTSSRCPLGKW